MKLETIEAKKWTTCRYGVVFDTRYSTKLEAIFAKSNYKKYIELQLIDIIFIDMQIYGIALPTMKPCWYEHEKILA